MNSKLLKKIIFLSLLFLFTPLLPSFGAVENYGQSLSLFTPLTSDTSSIKIAIIDSGVDLSKVIGFSPDRLLPGKDFTSTPGGELTDALGHGSEVLSVINLVNSTAKIMPLKIINEQGLTSLQDLIDAIYYATDQGVNIINISLGNPAFCTNGLMYAINYAYAHDVLVIAAAGNEGSIVDTCPASLAHVIGVGSFDEKIAKSSFSNQGSNAKILAPGEGINIPDLSKKGFSKIMGTSFAAPYITGEMAGILALHPSLKYDQYYNAIINTGGAQVYNSDQAGYFDFHAIDNYLTNGNLTKTKISATIDSITVNSGDQLTFSGKLDFQGELINKNLDLYFLSPYSSPTSWNKVATSSLNNDGTFSLNIPSTFDGSYLLLYQGDLLHNSSLSPVFALTANGAYRPTSTMSFSTPTSSLGETITLSLTAHVGLPIHALSGAFVTVYAAPLGGNRVLLYQGYTNDDGLLSFDWLPESANKYNITANIVFNNSSFSNSFEFYLYKSKVSVSSITKQAEIYSISFVDKSGIPISSLPITPQIYENNLWINGSTLTTDAEGKINISYDSTPHRVRYQILNQGTATNGEPGFSDEFLIDGSTVANLTLHPDLQSNNPNPPPASPQSITFLPLSEQTLDVGQFELSATSTSNLPVSFLSNDNNICTVQGSTLSLRGPGLCSITATQIGLSGLWMKAAELTRSFMITIPTPTPSIQIPLPPQTPSPSPAPAPAPFQESSQPAIPPISQDSVGNTNPVIDNTINLVEPVVVAPILPNKPSESIPAPSLIKKPLLITPNPTTPTVISNPSKKPNTKVPPKTALKPLPKQTLKPPAKITPKTTLKPPTKITPKTTLKPSVKPKPQSNGKTKR